MFQWLVLTSLLAAEAPAAPPPAPPAEEARALAAAVPPSLDVVGPRLHARASMPADEPPLPPAPRPGEGVTVYAEREAPPASVRSDVHPLNGWSPTGYAEDTRVGPYGQPEWTTDRRWARVRSYVLPPWQIEFESWYRGRFKKHDAGDVHLFQEEVGIGLPHRFQFDVYLNFEDNPDQAIHFKETQLELRYALADWDCLPLNPTLYLEYKMHDDPDASDAVEAKLLLSDDLGCRWHWGVNLTYERELDGEEEEVLGATAAVSYNLIDQRLGVGAEIQYEAATVEGARGDYENTLYLGPSVQIRFDHRTHLDIAPLFGLTDASDNLQLFVVFGIDIGPGGGEGGWLNPVSARSR